MDNLNPVKNMANSKIKLKTMGCCFLCLKFTEENSVSLKSLQRFLKISSSTVKNSFNPTKAKREHSYFKKEKEIEVDVCEFCSELMNKFSESFSLLELVQMEVDYLLDRIHQTISDSQNAPETLQNRFDRINKNPTEVEITAQVNSMNAVRTEIIKKSLKRKTQLQPKIILQQAKPSTTSSLASSSSSSKICLVREIRQKFKIKRKSQTKTTTKTAESSLTFLEPLENHSEAEQTNTKKSFSSLAVELVAERKKRFTKPVKKRKIKYSQLSATGTKTASSCSIPVNSFHSFSSSQQVSVDEENPNRKTTVKTIANKEKTEDEGMQMCIRNPNTGKFDGLSCNKSFSGGKNARRHYEAAHLKKRYKCDACGYSYTYQCHLIRHKSSFCKPWKYPGGRPQRTQSYSFNALTAMYSCVECKKELKSRAGIYLHYQSVHLKKTFKNEFFNTKVFKDRRIFNKHKDKCRLLAKIPTPSPQKQLEMQDGNKAKNVEVSDRKMEGEIVRSVNIAESIIATNSNTLDHNPDDDATPTNPNRKALNKNKNTQRKKIISKKSKATGLYDCPSCPRKFSKHSHARAHYESFHLRKRYECNLCGNRFASKQTVAKHKRFDCTLVTGKVKSKHRAGRECYFNQLTQKYRCSKCGNEYGTRHSAWEHFREDHSKSDLAREQIQTDSENIPTNNSLTNEENLSASEPVLEMKIIVKTEESSTNN